MRRCLALLSGFTAAALTTSGCGGSSRPPAIAADRTPLPSAAPIDARTQLAGLAATAKDRHFQAGYAWSQAGHSARTVSVVLAVDGSWRVDVPGASVAGTRKGLYQCRLAVDQPMCGKVAAAGGTLPPSVDPRVQHPFVDWLDPMTDRQAALSVAQAPLLTGARGACFSIEANSAALTPPVDPGIYCYDVDGTLTGVRTSFGTLVLATAVAPGPATITLPGPVVAAASPPPSP
jgi:hypothetical protein